MNTYRKQREQFQFTDSITQVVGLVKTARNYAVTSRAAYDGTKSFIPPEGYGIAIDKTTGDFILFANSGINPDTYDVGDIEEESYTLPDVSEIKSILQVDEEGTESSIGDEAVIIFKPPLADTFLGNNSSAVNRNELKFTFQRRNAPEDAVKIIKINKTAGFPEIEL